jgi:uncharacterized protein YecE (DUF72 family)
VRESLQRATRKGIIRIGISGWRYEPWRGVFYPDALPQRLELEYASRMFRSIEINGSFYSLQSPNYYASWRDQTPANFVFSVKGPRYITHMRRLKDIQAPLANFFANGLLELREKLGPILWQFPPTLRFEPDLFKRFFEQLPRDTFAARETWRGTTIIGWQAESAYRGSQEADAACGRDPPSEFRRRTIHRDASALSHRTRGRRHCRQMAATRRSDERLRLHSLAR